MTCVCLWFVYLMMMIGLFWFLFCRGCCESSFCVPSYSEKLVAV